MKPLFALVAIAVLAVAALCAFRWISAFRPNSRMYIHGNISLLGKVHDGAVLYHGIDIGKPDEPYRGTCGVVVRVGATEIALDSATEGDLARVARRQAPVGNWGSVTWPQEAVEYRMGGVRLLWLAGRVQGLSIVEDGSGRPVALSTQRCARWYSAPLSEDSAVDLFGPPDRTHDFFMH